MPEERRANDATLLEQQALVLDALFGIRRPPLNPNTLYYYKDQMSNGMSQGLINAVKANRDSVTTLVKSGTNSDSIKLNTKQIIGIIVALASAVGADRLLGS